MRFVADLHVHSKYSRAVSQAMVLPEMQKWAGKKGIDLLSAADFTHPIWFREISSQLTEDGEGVYKLKDANTPTRFVLSTEISSIYTQGGKVRRIHNLIFVPNLETAHKFSAELLKRGCNLSSDGRPIVGLSSRNILDLLLTVNPNSFLIPCHAWTPWFSLYGSNSGFDSIDECFQDLSKEIFGIETGLSSDPEMNWRIPELDNRSILSFSDAHSAVKIAREATVFDLESLNFPSLKKAVQKMGENKVDSTIEFYPEEGKYHYTGHRNCGVVQTPEETAQKGNVCPVCKRNLTVGVMHRVGQLAKRPTNTKISTDEFGVSWVEDPTGLHPKYVKLVPLVEILSECLSVMPGSLKVLAKFDEMVEKFNSEIEILLKTKTSDIEKDFGERIASGISRVRKQNIEVSPGFDGEFGKVKIWNPQNIETILTAVPEEQLGLF